MDCIGCGVFFWNKNILNTRNALLIPCKCNIDVILLDLHLLFTTAKKIADVVCDRKRQRGRRSSLHKKVYWTREGIFWSILRRKQMRKAIPEFPSRRNIIVDYAMISSCTAKTRCLLG